MNRRNFLMGQAAAACLAGLARGQDAARAAKLDRISIMTNDLYAILPEIWDRSKQAAPKTLDMMDLPDAVADRLHLHNLEVCSMNLLSMEPSYLGQFKQRLQKAKSKVVDLVVEIDGPGAQYRGRMSACSPDAAIRAEAIEKTKQWIDIAAALGSPSVMVNQGTAYLPDDLTPCIEGLRTLAAYGKSKNVVILLEPRGGKMTPEQMVDLMKASGVFANPDIGNFANEEVRARGLRLMYPLAPTVSHVKLNRRFNFVNAIKISKEMGFKGWYSIEAGDEGDPWVEIQKVIDALLENI